MKPSSAVLLILAASSVSACGTMTTRSPARPIGSYPFGALYVDGIMIGQMFQERVVFPSFDMSGVEIALWGIVSLPVDLVLDAVFLPADLVGWAFGAEKHRGTPWNHKL